jgi:4a-hydroxytetrahydrobiopterin dehydratase
MSRLLSADELSAALSDLPEWTGDTAGISRTVVAPSFPAGVELVTEVAAAAEAANHHPDIDIRWRTVTFRLSTHDADGVTRYDVDLAKEINALVWRRFSKAGDTPLG